METDVVVQRVSDGLQQTLRRISSLAGGLAVLATVISAATFATGLWIFKGTGRPKWIIIGGAICLVPVAAAVFARVLVGRTAAHAPELVSNVRAFLGSSSKSAKVLIDHDTGQPVATYAKNLSGLRGELNGLTFDGGSAIYDPQGRVLAAAGAGDEVVSWQLDRGVLEQTRREHPMLADVRSPAPVSQFEVM